jgi:hypothetical protein
MVTPEDFQQWVLRCAEAENLDEMEETLASCLAWYRACLFAEAHAVAAELLQPMVYH